MAIDAGKLDERLEFSFVIEPEHVTYDNLGDRVEPGERVTVFRNAQILRLLRRQDVIEGELLGGERALAGVMRLDFVTKNMPEGNTTLIFNKKKYIVERFQPRRADGLLEFEAYSKNEEIE